MNISISDKPCIKHKSCFVAEIDFMFGDGDHSRQECVEYHSEDNLIKALETIKAYQYTELADISEKERESIVDNIRSYIPVDVNSGMSMSFECMPDVYWYNENGVAYEVTYKFD